MATVLLVEDDAGILKNLSEYLCAEGFKIETARGQAERNRKLRLLKSLLKIKLI